MSRKFAVCAYLSEGTDRQRELRLDDLKLSGRSPEQWDHWAFFTSIRIDKERAFSHSLTETEYSAIGKAVVARLVALQSLENYTQRPK